MATSEDHVIAFSYATPRRVHEEDSNSVASDGSEISESKWSDFSDEPEDLVYTDADFDTSDDEYDMSDDERDDDVTVCKADLAYLKGLQRAEHEITTDKELTNFLKSKTAKSHYPATWKQFRSNTAEARIAKNARELLASVGASRFRSVTCALTTTPDAEAHLDDSPLFSVLARERFEFSAQLLFTEKYPPKTTKMTIHLEEKATVFEWCKSDGLMVQSLLASQPLSCSFRSRLARALRHRQGRSLSLHSSCFLALFLRLARTFRRRHSSTGFSRCCCAIEGALALACMLFHETLVCCVQKSQFLAPGRMSNTFRLLSPVRN